MSDDNVTQNRTSEPIHSFVFDIGDVDDYDDVLSRACNAVIHPKKSIKQFFERKKAARSASAPKDGSILLGGGSGLSEREMSKKEEMYLKLIERYENSTEEIVFGTAVGVKELKAIENKCNAMLSGTRTFEEVIDLIMTAKAVNEGIYAHMLNVAVMSCMVARWGGVPKEEFGPVFICGLMHDIGRADCKFEKESPQYMRHTSGGYAILTRGNNSKIDVHVRNCCLQHHEYYDGSGYPFRLKGNEIDRYARIVTIANEFVTFVEKGANPRGAVSIMKDVSSRYDPKLFEPFLDNMSKMYQVS